MLGSTTTAAIAVFRAGTRTTAPMLLLRCNSGGASSSTVTAVAPFSPLSSASITTTTATISSFSTPSSPNSTLAPLSSSQSVAAPKLPSQPARQPFSTAAFRAAHPVPTSAAAPTALATLAKTRPSDILLRYRPPQQPCNASQLRPSSTLPRSQNQQPQHHQQHQQQQQEQQQQQQAQPIDASPAARGLELNTTPTRPASQTQRVPHKPPAASSPSPASTLTSAPASGQPLDWDSFFRLRKTRRRWQLAFSVALALGLGSAGALALGSGVAEPVTAKIPLEPMISLGLMVLGTALLGWLLGPSVGNAVFNATNAQHVRAAIAEKESQFFARVRKYRVDPSGSSSMGNTIPDFYGEKISSVAGYRRWLQDQRAYNKKRTTFFT